MDFSDVVLKRRMIRHFSDEPVDPAAIERILDLARHAPSAGFTQGQSFIVVTETATKRAIAEICGEQEYTSKGFHPFISTAPVLLIPCANEAAYHRRYQEPDKLNEQGQEDPWPVPYWHMDIGCSVMIVLLAAVDEGLAAGFAGALDLAPLRALLGIPEEVTPVGVIPIGHRSPDVRSQSIKRGRVPDAVYVHRERW